MVKLNHIDNNDGNALRLNKPHSSCWTLDLLSFILKEYSFRRPVIRQKSKILENEIRVISEIACWNVTLEERLCYLFAYPKMLQNFQN